METSNPTIKKDPHQMSWAELKEFIASIFVQMQKSRKEVEQLTKAMDFDCV